MFASSQLSSDTLPVTVDSMDSLFEFIDTNITPSDHNELDELIIQKIYADLTNVENSTNDQYMLYLHLDSDELISQEKSSRVNSSDDSQSSPMSITSLSSDNGADECYSSTEWSVGDTSTSKIRPPKLFEFLHLLLDNPKYISHASWLNKDKGIFKIHKPTHVANLWKKVKSRKSHRSMDYETFSRGIRYYYKLGSMIKTHTKYTYCFAQV